METNVREGSEGARQIAPAVHATPETRRVWIGLAIVVALALLLPGCDPAPKPPAIPADAVVIQVEGSNGWDALRSLIFGAVIVVGISATRRYWTKRMKLEAGADEIGAGGVSSDLAQFDELHERLAKERTARIGAEQDLRAAQVRVRDLEISKADARHVADEYAAEAKALRNVNAGLSADLAHMRSKVAADQAALDACAELLSGPNAPGEHTAARVALRATGRLGGVKAEEAKPVAATLCRCGHTNALHAVMHGVRSGPCLCPLADGNYCPCEALDVVAQAAGSGS